jgi:WD40 repeat protein
MLRLWTGLSLITGITLLSSLAFNDQPKYSENEPFPFAILAKPAARMKFRGACTNLDISPDGRYAAVVADQGDHIYLVDIVKQKVVASTEASFPSGVFFSPDGKWLARRGPQGPQEDETCHAAIYEASTLKPVKVPLVPPVTGPVSWSSDGSYFAVSEAFELPPLFPFNVGYNTVVWSAGDWNSPGKIVQPLLQYAEALKNKRAVKSLAGRFLGRDLYIVVAEEEDKGKWRYYVHKYVPPDWHFAERFGPIIDKATAPAMFAYVVPHVPDMLFFYQWLNSHVRDLDNPAYTSLNPRLWSFCCTTKQFTDWGSQKVIHQRIMKFYKEVGRDAVMVGSCQIFPATSETLFVGDGTGTWFVIRKTNKGFELNDFDYDGYPISKVEDIIPNKKWLVVRLFNVHLTPPGNESGLIGGWLVGVLDQQTGKRVGPTYYHPSYIFSGCVKATPDGKYVLVGYEDGSLLFWPIMPDAAQENK